LFQLSDTPTSAVKFFYSHETREFSRGVRSITGDGCSTQRSIRELETTDNEKEPVICNQKMITDHELLVSEFHSGCPLRHKLFDCEFIIAPLQK